MPKRSNDATIAALPANGFLAEYLDYAERLTDAPKEFHVFTALTVLGAAAARVRIPYGPAMTAPTLWTVLVAPSAFYRKTTCVELGRRLLAQALPAAAPATIYDSAEVASRLRPGDRLLTIDDFCGLLNAEPCERLIAMDDAGSRLSLVATAPMATLAHRLAVGGLASGFLARFAFVVAEEKSEWHTLPGQPDPAAEQSLAAHLEKASRLEGTVSLAALGDPLNRWGQETAAWLNGFGSNHGQFNAAAGLVSRLELTAIKLAVLLEISASGTLEVSESSFTTACQLEHRLRACFERVAVQHGGKESYDEMRLLSQLLRHPGITRTQLQQNSHLDAGSFNRALSGLNGSGRLRRQSNRLFPAENGAAAEVAGASKSAKLASKRANGHLIETAEVGG